MKTLFVRGLKFLARLAIAGIWIALIALIIYGVVYLISCLTGRSPSDDYTFLKQYYDAGFCVGLVALSYEVKKYWR